MIRKYKTGEKIEVIIINAKDQKEWQEAIFIKKWNTSVIVEWNGHIIDFNEKDTRPIVKRWRNKKGGDFYSINALLDPFKTIDLHDRCCNILYEKGNYFKTVEDAELVADLFKKTLKKYLDANTK